MMVSRTFEIDGRQTSMIGVSISAMKSSRIDLRNGSNAVEMWSKPHESELPRSPSQTNLPSVGGRGHCDHTFVRACANTFCSVFPTRVMP